MPQQHRSFPTLPLTTLSETSPVPLYHQIELDLRALISAGKLKPGDTLPPEHELCRAYGVGRHTIRMALARLTSDGLIERQAGRGTFVKPVSDKQEFHLDRSFTRHLADMGVQARSLVLRAERCGPDDVANPAASASPFFCLDRLRLGDDEPIGLQFTIVMAELCPGIERFDFAQRSLYDVLASEYGLKIVEIRHAITAVIADETQADLLRLDTGSPLLLVKTTAYVAPDRVIESTTSYYRADRYEYTTTDTYPRASASKTRLSTLTHKTGMRAED